MTIRDLTSQAPKKEHFTGKDISSKQRLLELADTCFEVFSLRELKRSKHITKELSLSYPEATREEITSAIELAIAWRRTLIQAAKWVQ
jgi:hypothetical protein